MGRIRAYRDRSEEQGFDIGYREAVLLTFAAVGLIPIESGNLELHGRQGVCLCILMSIQVGQGAGGVLSKAGEALEPEMSRRAWRRPEIRRCERSDAIQAWWCPSGIASSGVAVLAMPTLGGPGMAKEVRNAGVSLEGDPRFLKRTERARASLRAGRGVRLEDIDD